MGLRCAIGLLVFGFPALSSSAGPKPETQKAWDEYIQQVSLRVKQGADGNGQFLWIDQDPLRAAQARRGEILAAPGLGEHGSQAVPNGLIHDWIGAVFIPGVTLAQVFAVVHDYDRYREFYGPTVVNAALLCRSDEEERLRMRYSQKVLFVTEVLDSEYEVHYVQLDARRWYSIAQSTRLQEPRDHGGPIESPGLTDERSRYVWRIYSISRYEQRDGGVYVEQESMVLSRTIPKALQWLVEPTIRRLSRHLLIGLLGQTREAVCSNAACQLPSADLPR